MGKRSNFEKRARDYYKTPAKAVEPLIPFLSKSKPIADYTAGRWGSMQALDRAWIRDRNSERY